MSELTASVNTKQDVLEIIPMQLLLGGELKLLSVYAKNVMATLVLAWLSSSVASTTCHWHSSCTTGLVHSCLPTLLHLV